MGPVRHVIEAYSKEITALAGRRHALSIRLFGSAARLDDGDASDADFLVDFGPEASILDVVHLRLDLEHLLGFPVDVVPLGGLTTRDTHIIEESIPV